MKFRCMAILLLAGLRALAAEDQGSILQKIKWQEGPSIGNLAGTAQIKVPGGYLFAGAKDTRLLMEAMQNPTSGREQGFLAPAKFDWFVVFEFDDVGYIKDDEKGSLDAEAMLKSIMAGNEASNAERKKRGWPTMVIQGWEQKPHYNETTHNLEWAIRGESEGKLIINHNTRILGRKGVMRITLVTEPELLTPSLPKFKDVLAGFDFQQGQRYAEFRQGDKIAKYGLSALIVGGATAAAVKTGMFKWLWKAIVVGAVAIGAFLKKIFAGKKTQ